MLNLVGRLTSRTLQDDAHLGTLITNNFCARTVVNTDGVMQRIEELASLLLQAAIALSFLVAELAGLPFKNSMMTFSREAAMHDVGQLNLVDKVRSAVLFLHGTLTARKHKLRFAVHMCCCCVEHFWSSSASAGWYRHA